MKKAITPLISTVVLLVFAIGLGTLVMSWGMSENEKITDCDKVNMGVTSLNSKVQACTENGYLQLILENNGRAKIVSVDVVNLYADSVENSHQTVNIAPGEFKRISIPIKENILKTR